MQRLCVQPMIWLTRGLHAEDCGQFGSFSLGGVHAEDGVQCVPVSWVVCMQSLTPAEVRAEKRALVLRKAAEEEKRKSDLWASVRRLLKSPSFQVGRTLTCALPMAA